MGSFRLSCGFLLSKGPPNEHRTRRIYARSEPGSFFNCQQNHSPLRGGRKKNEDTLDKERSRQRRRKGNGKLWQKRRRQRGLDIFPLIHFRSPFISLFLPLFVFCGLRLSDRSSIQDLGQGKEARRLRLSFIQSLRLSYLLPVLSPC